VRLQHLLHEAQPSANKCNNRSMRSRLRLLQLLHEAKPSAITGEIALYAVKFAYYFTFKVVDNTSCFLDAMRTSFLELYDFGSSQTATNSTN
jgi:hypothetical protein